MFVLKYGAWLFTLNINIGLHLAERFQFTLSEGHQACSYDQEPLTFLRFSIQLQI